MSIEKNQNPDFGDRASSEQAKSLEQKQALQQQILELRTLNMQIEAQKQGEKVENTDVVDYKVLSQLDTLQKRVDALDHKNTQHFQSEVQKIEEQLDTIKKTRAGLASFKKSLAEQHLGLKKIQSQIQNQLADHDPRANAARAKSYENILNIAPQKGDNPLANRAARIIQKLVS